MGNIVQDQVLEALQWRYATKKFDPAKKISSAHWKVLEQALVLSPSSFGLQPWKFVVVEDVATRNEIKGAAWNQSQIVDASHLVVLCAKQDMGAPDVERLIQRICEVRGVTPESLSGYREAMLGFFASPSPGFEVSQWTARQVYIALGFFLSAAANLGIDACPMEGFDTQRVSEILKLPEQGFRAVVIATAGYRSSDDAYASAAKTRFSTDQVVSYR